MIQSIVPIVWLVASTAVFSALAIVASLFTRTGELPHLVARTWARSVLWVSRIRITVEGMENIDKGGSCIFMANHASQFDIHVLLGHLRVQFRWLAKAELFKIPLFGYAMRRAGYISIDRSNRRSAFLSLKRAGETIKNGTSVVIFPEGTRNREENIAPFKTGGFVLAVDAGVPIVPVVIHGTRQIMPKNRLRITPGCVRLEIKRPIPTTEYTRKTKNDLLERVRQVISESYERGKQTVMQC